VAAKILVIEDDPASANLMEYLLTAHGYTALVCADGTDGLAMAHDEMPDLILCDIQLPGIDGYTIATRLKSDPGMRAIPLIAMTAMAMVGDREKVLAAGFDAYLSKPVDPMQFAAQIEPLLPKALHSIAEPRAAAEHAELTQPPARATLLLVDDLPVNLELERSIFEPNGYHILTANDVELGLEMARAHRPDLIIADIGLGKSSGFDLLRQVKADAELSKTPVVIVTTTHHEASARRTALTLGADHFLLRPLDPEQLLREVEACLPETIRGTAWPSS
jgi:two-component system cell cycle response regulator